ncbi:MAG: hypothetical protein ACXVH6_05885, partial [Halobacteriota archaeon]
NSQQIETLIFYLKSLHNYHPASENHVAYFDRFNNHLNKLRTSESQTTLQAKATKLMLLAMIVGGLGGVIFIAGAATIFTGVISWGVALIVAALGVFVLADAKFGTPALITTKEQDRRYFLQSLRSARGCNELDWAGLFSYNGVTKSGPQSDADIERTKARIAEMTEQLRNALYNDQYMEYTGSRSL